MLTSGHSVPLLRLIAPLSAALVVAAGCSSHNAAKATPPPAASDDGATSRASDSTITLADEQRSRIHLETIQPASFRPTIQTTGTVAFNGDRSTPVLSAISGPVSRILVTTGTRVTGGTPLATVASPDFSAAVASYQKAQSTLRNAARITTLDEQLFKNDAIARSDLDQARADSASAYADREAAVEQMVALGVDSATIDAIREGKPVAAGEGIIRAPIAGVVVEKLINPGQLIAAGTTQCFTIADLSTVWVMANVFEPDLGVVAEGESVLVATAAGDTLPGHVEYVGAIVDPNTRATAVRVVAVNRHDLLKRDMYVAVAIQASRTRTGLLTPVSAVLRDDNNLPFVFVAQPDSSFERRHVTLGSRVGERYEVAAGLAAGERVVTDGALFLQFAASQ
jgi:membrane fusion protein, heavy metal efflux system